MVCVCVSVCACLRVLCFLCDSAVYRVAPGESCCLPARVQNRLGWGSPRIGLATSGVGFWVGDWLMGGCWWSSEPNLLCETWRSWDLTLKPSKFEASGRFYFLFLRLKGQVSYCHYFIIAPPSRENWSAEPVGGREGLFQWSNPQGLESRCILSSAQ